MKDKFPIFKSRFLNDICSEFRRRQKAICIFGDISTQTSFTGDFEWIAIFFHFSHWPYLELQAVEDNRISLFIRLGSKKKKGKVIFELKNIIVLDCKRLVETFEWTIGQLHLLHKNAVDSNVLGEVRDQWMSLSLRTSKANDADN